MSYSLQPHEAKFFKEQTGIQDEDELKQHILKVQAKALKVYPCPCVQNLSFTKLRISTNPFYDRVLSIQKQHSDAIFLDIGCCCWYLIFRPYPASRKFLVGNDARKIVADGWHVENVGIYAVAKFWNLGHELFISTKDSFPAHFIAGDIFHSEFLSLESETDRMLPLAQLTHLTPLRGRTSAIHASSVFHLFSEERQLYFARALASLLSPTPGSVIFGSHLGLPEQGFQSTDTALGKEQLFCHSPSSWEKLWNGIVFDEGVVSVETKLIAIEAPGIPGAHFLFRNHDQERQVQQYSDSCKNKGMRKQEDVKHVNNLKHIPSL